MDAATYFSLLGLALALLLTNMWWANEYRFLKRRTDDLEEKAKEMTNFYWAARSAFSDLGMKYEKPKPAQSGRWVKES